MKKSKQIETTILTVISIEVFLALGSFVLNLFSISNTGYRKFFFDSLYLNIYKSSQHITSINIGLLNNYTHLAIFTVTIFIFAYLIIGLLNTLPLHRN